MARTDTLIQTLVPADLATWVRARAALEGLQVSGWVRQLIARERLRLGVDAWWLPNAGRRATTRPADPPPFRLERLGFPDALRVEFAWRTPSHVAVRDEDLATTYASIRSALYTGRFALRGDPRLWRVVHALADADADHGIRLVLEPEQPTGPTKTSRRPR